MIYKWLADAKFSREVTIFELPSKNKFNENICLATFGPNLLFRANIYILIYLNWYSATGFLSIHVERTPGVQLMYIYVTPSGTSILWLALDYVLVMFSLKFVYLQIWNAGMIPWYNAIGVIGKYFQLTHKVYWKYIHMMPCCSEVSWKIPIFKVPFKTFPYIDKVQLQKSVEIFV